MDGRMNKDVKIGLSIGLLALIAVFCLVVLPKGGGDKPESGTQPGPTSSDTSGEQTPPETVGLTGDATSLDSDSHAVVTMEGHELTDTSGTGSSEKGVNDETRELVNLLDQGADKKEDDTTPVEEDDTTLAGFIDLTPQRIYVVQARDTLSTISGKEYGSSRFWKKIQEANNLPDPDRIAQGDKLIIPALTDEDRGLTTSTTTSTTTTVDGVRRHKVAEGETLGEISRKYYGTTRHADRIMEANGITDARRVPIGTSLVIPDLPTTTTTTTLTSGTLDDTKKYHVVGERETLSEISRKYYGTTRLHTLIMKANGLSDPDRIRAGQRLLIPPKPDDSGSGARLVDSALKPGEQSYIVQRNDSPIKIAKRFYNDARLYDIILKRNGIARPEDLLAGEVIVIPPKPGGSMLMETRALSID